MVCQLAYMVYKILKISRNESVFWSFINFRLFVALRMFGIRYLQSSVIWKCYIYQFYLACAAIFRFFLIHCLIFVSKLPFQTGRLALYLNDTIKYMKKDFFHSIQRNVPMKEHLTDAACKCFSWFLKRDLPLLSQDNPSSLNFAHMISEDEIFGFWEERMALFQYRSKIIAVTCYQDFWK